MKYVEFISKSIPLNLNHTTMGHKLYDLLFAEPRHNMAD